jgi:hypothetical protein
VTSRGVDASDLVVLGAWALIATGAAARWFRWD